MAALSDDDLLRLNGFTIYKRPKYGEAIWMRDRKYYTQSQALALCDRRK